MVAHEDAATVRAAGRWCQPKTASDDHHPCQPYLRPRAGVPYEGWRRSFLRTSVTKCHIKRAIRKRPGGQNVVAWDQRA